MAVTFDQDGNAVETIRPQGLLSSDVVETYGRFNLTLPVIAQLEGLTRAQVAQQLRNPSLREAYERGRAQCAVALRQKIIAMALAGSERMLLYAGKHFAGLKDDETPAEENFEPDTHTWGEILQQRLDEIQIKYIDKDKTSEDG